MILSSNYLGGNLGNFLISFMVLMEVPIHKYFSGPQNCIPVTLLKGLKSRVSYSFTMLIQS